MKIFSWLKSRIKHKIDGFSIKKIKRFLKENGLAFVIIVVGWEVVEDVVFPIIFGVLGNYVHPAFYVGIPASLILCFHWLAIPILWGLWIKIKSQKKDLVEVDCCSKD
tara:strand:+ start:542 stop:865 length:324 start_codon:yes stop_codon:yes gene_type:complete